MKQQRRTQQWRVYDNDNKVAVLAGKGRLHLVWRAGGMRGKCTLADRHDGSIYLLLSQKFYKSEINKSK